MERLLVINLSCNEWDDIPELGLLALTGYMAIAAHVKPLAAFGNNGAMPGLINTFAAIIVNLILAIILTPIFNGIGLKSGEDSTQPTDYDVEVELPEEVGEEALR
jgi:hypothetical protein